jgi:hypothetical protein
VGPEDILPYRDLALRLLDPLLRAVESREHAEALLRDLGYAPPSQVLAFDELGPVAQSLIDLINSIEDAVESEDADAIIGALIDLGRATGELLRALNSFHTKIQQNFSGSNFLTQTDILAALPRKLGDYLIARFLANHHSTLYAGMAMAGIVDVEKIEDAPTSFNVPYLKRVVNWDKVPALLTDPVGTLKANIAGADELLFNRFIFLLGELGVALGLPAGYASPEEGLLETFNQGADLTDRPGFDELVVLRLPLLDDPAASVGLDFYPLIDPATGKHTGVGAGLRFGAALEIPLSDAYRMLIKLSAALENGLGVTVDRDGNVTFINKVFGASPDTLAAATQFGIRISIEPTAEGPDGKLLSLGAPPDNRLEIGSGAVAIGIEKLDTFRVLVEADLSDGVVTIAARGADGFLAKILPSEAIEATFGLGVGISNVGGLYFKGSSGLLIRVPLHLSLGPAELHFLSVSIASKDQSVPVEVTTGLSAKLGPLAAAVEDVGVRATFTISAGRTGNLGPLDVAFGFRPPSGAGLSLNAAVVKGGGFLKLDFERGEYTGALELTFSGVIALKAIGLITTKMPDGRPGFSLLIIITAEFGTGVQLGFGFTLLAVGGLIGLNRTMKLQPLMDGIRTGAINGIMFPQDVVANAPKIISDLRTIFPPQEGTFLIGPMAKLAWGTPPLITLSLGVIIEIPGNIALIGVLRVALPADDVAIIVLQVNFAGAIEFDKKRIYFFAALFESRILFLSIEGEMGLLVAFGEDANFVVSVGGFHPRYNPPPLPFPSPRRVSVSLVNSPVARVRIEGYFAVTSNTVQFGARVDLFFGLGPINVDGHLAFDALFQFSPFYFIILISASLSVNVFGVGLLSVRIRGELEGPTPWRARGEGSIALLFFTIPVEFDVTWGESRDTTLPPIPVMPMLKAEFEKAPNWAALLPASNNLLVSLRKLSPEEKALVLHPVGVLRVTQRLLPLELRLDKVGTQRPNDVNRLSVKVTGAGLGKTGDAFEQFALGQYQDMSDDDRLSRPAFGPERGGLDLSAAGQQLRSSRMVRRVVRYEEIILDSNFKRFVRPFSRFTASLFNFFLARASVAKSDLSTAKQKQFQPFEEKVDVTPETFSVAHQASNKAYAADAVSFLSEASARDYMEREIAKDPGLAETLHVIPDFERVA